MDNLGINKHDELLPEERKLLQHVLRTNERSIAFDEYERGSFRQDYFTDYRIPTVPHNPSIERNRYLPKGEYNEIVNDLKNKIRAGVYERAHTVYRSRWFCVKKKDG